jgi:hypothetical protein
MPSSVIHSFDYDPSARELTITFVSGKVYVYLDVPPMIHSALERASSRGAFFNSFIRDRYAFERRVPASAA